MPVPVSAEPQFLLVPEVAAIARVSVGTVRHWIAIGKLPSVKPGRRVMVRLAVLEQFLAAAERVPKAGLPRGR
jgi:excisionase family DNA binding protein